MNYNRSSYLARRIARKIINEAKTLARPITSRFEPDRFMRKAKGVIHVGANTGQERDVYAAHDLNVLWIEPIPEVFKRLNDSLKEYPKQRAVCRLVGDQDDKEYVFHVSSNDGKSSSILGLAEHKEMWPHVSFTNDLRLKSVTLSSLAKDEKIDWSHYDALVMDTQGSEMLVLKGATDILGRFKFIKTEVADFESYTGCCQLPEMDKFMNDHGFRRIAKKRFAHKEGVGSYFDVLYRHARKV